MPTLCKVVQTNDALATLISENKVSLLGTDLRMLMTGFSSSIDESVTNIDVNLLNNYDL